MNAGTAVAATTTPITTNPPPPAHFPASLLSDASPPRATDVCAEAGCADVGCAGAGWADTDLWYGQLRLSRLRSGGCIVFTERGPGARDDDAADRDPLRNRQSLAQQHHPDERGDRGFQAHPDTEDPGRYPAQGLKLES